MRDPEDVGNVLSGVNNLVQTDCKVQTWFRVLTGMLASGCDKYSKKPRATV